MSRYNQPDGNPRWAQREHHYNNGRQRQQGFVPRSFQANGETRSYAQGYNVQVPQVQQQQAFYNNARQQDTYNRGYNSRNRNHQQQQHYYPNPDPQQFAFNQQLSAQLSANQGPQGFQWDWGKSPFQDFQGQVDSNGHGQNGFSGSQQTSYRKPYYNKGGYQKRDYNKTWNSGSYNRSWKRPYDNIDATEVDDAFTKRLKQEQLELPPSEEIRPNFYAHEDCGGNSSGDTAPRTSLSADTGLVFSPFSAPAPEITTTPPPPTTTEFPKPETAHLAKPTSQNLLSPPATTLLPPSPETSAKSLQTPSPAISTKSLPSASTVEEDELRLRVLNSIRAKQENLRNIEGLQKMIAEKKGEVAMQATKGKAVGELAGKQSANGIENSEKMGTGLVDAPLTPQPSPKRLPTTLGLLEARTSTPLVKSIPEETAEAMSVMGEGSIAPLPAPIPALYANGGSNGGNSIPPKKTSVDKATSSSKMVSKPTGIATTAASSSASVPPTTKLPTHQEEPAPPPVKKRVSLVDTLFPGSKTAKQKKVDKEAAAAAKKAEAAAALKQATAPAPVTAKAVVPFKAVTLGEGVIAAISKKSEPVTLGEGIITAIAKPVEEIAKVTAPVAVKAIAPVTKVVPPTAVKAASGPIVKDITPSVSAVKITALESETNANPFSTPKTATPSTTRSSPPAGRRSIREHSTGTPDPETFTNAPTPAFSSVPVLPVINVAKRTPTTAMSPASTRVLGEAIRKVSGGVSGKEALKSALEKKDAMGTEDKDGLVGKATAVSSKATAAVEQRDETVRDRSRVEGMPRMVPAPPVALLPASKSAVIGTPAINTTPTAITKASTLSEELKALESKIAATKSAISSSNTNLPAKPITRKRPGEALTQPLPKKLAPASPKKPARSSSPASPKASSTKSPRPLLDSYVPSRSTRRPTPPPPRPTQQTTPSRRPDVRARLAERFPQSPASRSADDRSADDRSAKPSSRPSTASDARHGSSYGGMPVIKANYLRTSYNEGDREHLLQTAGLVYYEEAEEDLDTVTMWEGDWELWRVDGVVRRC